MSFILDALKKSETERQRQNTPGFTDVPDSTDPPRAPRWLWVLGGLLAVNLVVLLGVMLRPDAPATGVVTVPGAANSDERQAEPDASFSEMVEEAKKKQTRPADHVTQADGAGDRSVVEQSPAPAATPAASVTNSYATFDELRANGTIVLPDLHLDIHVYSDQPSERFVFVNMNKYRENSKLVEGPLVKEITPEGVILEHLGNSFLLPRE
jgi:general secretion pathway protein B